MCARMAGSHCSTDADGQPPPTCSPRKISGVKAASPLRKQPAGHAEQIRPLSSYGRVPREGQCVRDKLCRGPAGSCRGRVGRAGLVSGPNIPQTPYLGRATARLQKPEFKSCSAGPPGLSQAGVWCVRPDAGPKRLRKGPAEACAWAPCPLLLPRGGPCGQGACSSHMAEGTPPCCLDGRTNENVCEPRGLPLPAPGTAHVPTSLFSRDTPVTSHGRDHLATKLSQGGSRVW